jgi:hypothetical protein
MRPGIRLSDREILERLLRYASLTPSERTVFQRWYDDLSRNTIVELTPRNRLWVEAVYEQHDVGRLRAEARRRTRKDNQTTREAPTFAPMFLPKKPPGRLR